MKKTIRKKLLIFLLPMLLTCGCSGLQGTNKVVFTTGFGSDEVFRIEDSVCSLKEMMVYLVNTQNGYENSFGSQLWELNTEGGTVEEKLKESVLSKLAQIKAMNLLADDMGISLDEKEISLVNEAANKYYDSLSESDIQAMQGADLDTIIRIYSEYALAEKLYDYIIKDINPEISDDEARTITIEQIFLKTYTLGADGEKVPVSDTEKENIRYRMKSINSKLLEGTSFEELMASYNEAEEGTISFGKGEVEQVLEEAAFKLGKEEVSDILELEDGYAIIKCISTFNREETEYNKVRIVRQRRKEVFGEKYDSFVSTLTKELNEKLWDRISLSEDENVTTDNLWDVYLEYF